MVIDLSVDTPFKPRVVKWLSHDLFKNVTISDVIATPEVRQEVHHDLWGDMCAEYDAGNLWHHLNNLDIKYSTEFKDALVEWKNDERNHYVGLRLICSFMYDIPESDIDKQMANRVPDFTDIARFLTNEFRICVVLAYDELVSAMGYKMFDNDFKKFGPREFLQFVRRAARDEMLHYKNFLDVIRLVHTDEIEPVKNIIREIADYEMKPDMSYHATFLLDHTEETFRREFLLDCGKKVVKDFSMLCSRTQPTQLLRRH